MQESMFVEGEGLSEIPTDFPGVSRGGSFVNTTQAPSPSSAIMTVSLDAYLDPQRISYGSPADFEMVPRISSPDDTFPVFSPPPFDVKIAENSSRFDISSPNFANQDRDQRALDQNMLVPPNANGGGSSSGSSVAGGAPQPSRRHRRLSSLNTVSWPNPNELTVSPRPPRRMSTVAGSEAGVQEEDDVNLRNLRISSNSHVLLLLGRRQVDGIASNEIAEEKVELQHFNSSRRLDDGPDSVEKARQLHSVVGDR